MKTISLKKVSAVAVASLGFGLLSVVPAHATALVITATPGTLVGTTVGTPVVLPIKVATGAATDADSKCIYTAAFTSAIPVNSALVSSNITAATTGFESPFVTTAAGDAVDVSASTNTLTVNFDDTTSHVAQISTAKIAGQISFTPDVAGVYTISVTAAATNATCTVTELTAVKIAVGGIQITQASAGQGTTAGTTVAGGEATAAYWVPSTAGSGQAYNFTSTGVGSITTAAGAANNSTRLSTSVFDFSADTAAGTLTRLNGTSADYAAGFKYVVAGAQASGAKAASATSDAVSFKVASSVAGTQTVTVTAINASTGAPTVVATATFTWGAAAAVSPTFSTAYLNSGATYAASTPTTGVSVTKTYSSTTAVANIGVSLKDGNNTALIGQKLTVTISGPGAISVTQGAITAGSTTAAATAGLRAVSETSANSGSQWMIGINADGTAGTSTITISVGTTVVATRTLSFYGSPSKITATQNYSIARAGSAGYELGDSRTNTTATTGYVPAVSVYVEDASANGVAATVTCLPADTTVIASCTIAADDNATYGAGTGYYNASVTSAPNGVSGKSTTVVFRTLLSTGAYVTSAPVTFTLGGAVVSTAVTLNKTSYAPGEAMVLTVTTKDASGNPSYDGQGILGSIASNKSVGGALPAITKVFAKGTYATSATAPTLFAPALSGAFTISGVSVATTAAPLGVAYSVSASVTDANAGLLTQIDALNAKIVALNALIAKIMKKLGVK